MVAALDDTVTTPSTGDILLITKIVERCNLDCTYCYMYHAADQSWRERPARLSNENLDRLTTRFTEHAQQYPKAGLTLELHGGEPLLLGKRRMQALLKRIRDALSPERLFICLQTNAVLLDEEWLDIFAQYEVHISLSCDGPPDVTNRYRRLRRDGGATGQSVEDAIRLCLRWPEADKLFHGVLAVADPQTDGAAIVRYFYALGVRSFDLLLPDANYISPPMHLPAYRHADLLRYMTRAFDEWISIQDTEFKIRTFRELILGMFGRKSALDAFGADLSTISVLESDGSYQLLDVLRICGEDATRTPLHIEQHSFADFLAATAGTLPKPCARCLTCAAFNACGGGYLPHRFDGVSYDNPSYFCDVLFGLHRHILTHLAKVTPPELWQTRGAATG